MFRGQESLLLGYSPPACSFIPRSLLRIWETGAGTVECKVRSQSLYGSVLSESSGRNWTQNRALTGLVSDCLLPQLVGLGCCCVPKLFLGRRNTRS